MTIDPKIHVRGPYDLETNSSEQQTSLYLVDMAQNNADTETNPQSIPGQDDDETILASLSGTQEFAYEGIGNGLRLYYGNYGTDPVDALHNWLFEFESLVLSGQGAGYELEDEERNLTVSPEGDSFGVLFDFVSWTHESGAPDVVEFRLEGQRTEGMQPAELRSDYINKQLSRYDPSISEDRVATEDGSVDVFLGDVEERSYQREVELNSMDIVHQYDVPSVGLAESGVQSEFTMSGRISNREVPDLSEAARLLTDDLHGQQATIRDAFSCRTWTGAVSDSSTEFSAGSPNLLEYDLTLTIGGDITSA